MSNSSLVTTVEMDPDGDARQTVKSNLRGLLIPFLQVATALAVLLSWELLVRVGLLDPFFFSRPARVLGYLLEYVGKGLFWKDAAFTLRAAGTGYLIGATAGLLFGFFFAGRPLLSRVLNPFILALYGIPRIALAPLFIIWFGIGINSKIALAALVSFFLTFIPTYTGVGQVEERYINVARVAGASQSAITLKVVLPSASPWIISGLRVAIPYALVAAIVGEFIASTGGLGFRIALNAQTFNMTGTFGGVFIIMVIVMTANLLLDRIERFVLRWQPPRSSRAGATW